MPQHFIPKTESICQRFHACGQDGAARGCTACRPDRAGPGSEAPPRPAPPLPGWGRRREATGTEAPVAAPTPAAPEGSGTKPAPSTAANMAPPPERPLLKQRPSARAAARATRRGHRGGPRSPLAPAGTALPRPRACLPAGTDLLGGRRRHLPLPPPLPVPRCPPAPPCGAGGSERCRCAV